MLICGLDLETTGLCFETDEIIEIGLVLWDTHRKAPVRMFNGLVRSKKPVSDEIHKITGIADSDLDMLGKPFDQYFPMLDTFLSAGNVEAVVAHNGNLFDWPMLEAHYKRHNVPLPLTGAIIDTSCDVPYPPHIKTRSLKHLAAEHGFLNPFSHRALFDVLTMLKVLSFYDFDEVLALSKEPAVVIQALCVKPWEDDSKSTDEAKANGFRWDGKLKQWRKTVKRKFLQDENNKAKLYKVAEV